MVLQTRGLEAFYGDAQALFGIDFHLSRGEVVAIIGANGAGKSTFLKCVTGLVHTPRDAIHFDGAPIGGLPPGEIVRRGIALVPEGRRLFPSLTVRDTIRRKSFCRSSNRFLNASSFFLSMNNNCGLKAAPYCKFSPLPNANHMRKK